MKILWLCAVSPWPQIYGGAVRTSNMLRQIADSEHDITFCLLGDPQAEVAPELQRYCAEIYVFKPDFSRFGAQMMALMANTSFYKQQHRSKSLDAWLEQHARAYDVAILESTHMSWAGVPPEVPRILNLQNIESELIARTAVTDKPSLRSFYRRQDALKLRTEEFKAFREAQQLWIPSEREAEVLTDNHIETPIVVMPNGVDCDKYQTGKVPFAVPELIFIGSAHYFPNQQGILWFYENVWPIITARRPETTLGFVGGQPKSSVQALASDRVLVEGFVPEVLPYYRGAKCTIVPLLSGGGTRLKMLEAAAVGSPIVTSSLGCEGLPVEHGVHCLIADEPEPFAEACLEVLAGGDAVKRRAEAARQLVVENYSWQHIGHLALAQLSTLENGHKHHNGSI